MGGKVVSAGEFPGLLPEGRVGRWDATGSDVSSRAMRGRLAKYMVGGASRWWSQTQRVPPSGLTVCELPMLPTQHEQYADTDMIIPTSSQSDKQSDKQTPTVYI